MRQPVIWIWLVLGLGVVAFFGGDVSGRCLGPLGVTVVGCASATGVIPSNPGADMRLGVWLVLGGLLALVRLRPSRRTSAMIAAATTIALPLGALLYAATRPLTLEGPITLLPGEPPGPYVVLPLPFEPEVAIGYAVISAGMVLAIAAIVLFARERRVS